MTRSGIPATLDTITALVNVASELQGFGESPIKAAQRAANILGIGKDKDALGLKKAAAKRVTGKSRECVRCGCDLDKKGRCTDVTCPFSECRQDDPHGWEGHPEAERLRAERRALR